MPVVDAFALAFAPGGSVRVLQRGYIVLALVVQRVSGQLYHLYVERGGCRRTNLAATGFLRSYHGRTDRGGADAGG